MKCPGCGGDFKNLGVHQRFCKQQIMLPGEVIEVDVDDYIMEKPLSSVISDIRDILKRYHEEIQVTTVEKDGTTLVELTVRFQSRR